MLHLWLLAALTSFLIGEGPARSRALLGLAASGLGVASLAVNPGPLPLSNLLDPRTTAALPPSFVAMNSGLLLLGAILGILAGFRSLREWTVGATLSRAAAILSLATSGLLLGVAVVLVGFESVWRAGLVAGGVALIAWAGHLGGRAGHLGRWIRWIDERWLDRPRPLEISRSSGSAGDGKLLALVCLGGIGAIWGRHLAVVLLGAVIAAVSADRLDRGRDPGRFPTVSLLMLSLAPFAWLLTTIAGPTGLSLSALGEAPISQAAEILLLPPLALSAWGLIGLWPLHGLVPGPILAPIGWALLARLGLGLVPEGVAHWRPVLFPLAAIGIWHGAVSRRPAAAIAGLGVIGVLTGVEPGSRAGIGLLCVAAGMAAARRFRFPSKTMPWLSALVVLPAWAVLQALIGGLQTEAVYSVIAWAGAAAALSNHPQVPERR